ncbi:MAG: DUF4349 domain-containing protein [Chitinophagaceae bacterium]|nr:DUF4349 domain-containing protein [Chitinophagaceae bacterium]
MRYLIVGLYTFLLVTIAGCGHTENDQESGYAGDYEIQNKEEQVDQAPPPPPGNEGVTIERKLIKEGTIEYKVDNIATARKQILASVAKWKGYVGNESEYNTGDRLSTTIIIRVPAANFDSLLMAATLGVSHFDRKEILVKDVTEEFVDVEARLKTKKELEQRYLTLLGKANTVSEILEIEKEIGVLRADIESIEGKLNVLKSQVSFSTITITAYEIISAPSLFGERWVRSLSEGWQNLLDFLVGITSLWPFLLLIIGSYLGIRQWRRRKQTGK